MTDKPTEKKRDEMLLRLLRTPPKPRKGRQDDSGDSVDEKDDQRKAGRPTRKA